MDLADLSDLAADRDLVADLADSAGNSGIIETMRSGWLIVEVLTSVWVMSVWGRAGFTQKRHCMGLLSKQQTSVSVNTPGRECWRLLSLCNAHAFSYRCLTDWAQLIAGHDLLRALEALRTRGRAGWS